MFHWKIQDPSLFGHLPQGCLGLQRFSPVQPLSNPCPKNHRIGLWENLNRKAMESPYLMGKSIWFPVSFPQQTNPLKKSRPQRGVTARQHRICGDRLFFLLLQSLLPPLRLVDANQHKWQNKGHREFSSTDGWMMEFEVESLA